MASRKPLVMNAGVIEQLQAGDNLDATTTGVDVFQAEAVAALAIGDVVYVSGALTVSKAQANAIGTARPIGLAGAVIEASATGPIQTDGVLTGLTGLTAGSTYYLSDATAGAFTTTAPSEAGKFVVKIGTALSTTEMEISFGMTIKL